ncbi:TPA: ribonucleoside triphosphate reductase [bacterium]|nr:ribonucleoside triphosphate reductase [bacterium]
MIKYIRKRDGRLVLFNSEKITEAIFKATKAVGEPDRKKAENTTRHVVAALSVIYKDERIPTVENVQDLVEKMLIEDGYADVAKAYILYREQHAKLRETRDLLSDAAGMVDRYLGNQDWRVRENSNMSYSLQGLNNYIFSLITSNYWLSKLYPPSIKDAHISGDIHIHDIGVLSVYCCGWDLKDLLLMGFGGASGKVESSPPKHFRSALGQIVNFFYTLQGEAAGAQAFSNFDTLLSPFIRYDGLSYKEVRQCIQEFVFNMNIPTRVGFQTPFTNITMDVVPPRTLAKEYVIIGGKPQDTTYSEFKYEMGMINRAFCEVLGSGDAKGRVFTFPIPTYNITSNFDWDDEDLEPLWEITSKYGIPYFSNFINSDMDPEDARSMCCRLRLDNRDLRKKGGGLFGSNPLTGSIGVVTINLPRNAYLSDHSENNFFERLAKLMEIAKESLEIKRKVIERFTDEELYPYARHYLLTVKERFGAYWKNHFSTIGLIGMNEACINLIGKDIASPEGKEFAIKVLKFIREKILKFQEEADNLYNIEATPAEGTAYRLAMLDKEQYPDIITAGKERSYYTNSTHLPAGYTDDLFLALSHQNELQVLYTGGTVFHGFVGEKIDNPKMCKLLIRRIAEKFSIPYYTITPTFSICPIHGYIKGEHFTCPKSSGDGLCNTKCEVYSRVAGYYRPVQQWNDGKQEEFSERKEYKI